MTKNNLPLTQTEHTKGQTESRYALALLFFYKPGKIQLRFENASEERIRWNAEHRNWVIPEKEFSSVTFGLVYSQFATDRKKKPTNYNPKASGIRDYAALQQREKCS